MQPDTDWKGSLIGFTAGAIIRAEVALLESPQGDKVEFDSGLIKQECDTKDAPPSAPDAARAGHV